MKYFSRHSFGEIVSETSHDVTVKNIDGVKWSVSRKIFDEEFDLSDEFSENKDITRTELSDVLFKHPFTIMTVEFSKQVKEKEVKKKLHDLYPNKGAIISEFEFKQKCDVILEEVLKGEKRVLIGYHTGKVDNNGRVFFFDMEAKDPTGKPEFRLVDTRTLDSIIVKGVKYNLK